MKIRNNTFATFLLQLRVEGLQQRLHHLQLGLTIPFQPNGFLPRNLQQIDTNARVSTSHDHPQTLRRRLTGEVAYLLEFLLAQL